MPVFGQLQEQGSQATSPCTDAHHVHARVYSDAVAFEISINRYVQPSGMLWDCSSCPGHFCASKLVHTHTHTLVSGYTSSMQLGSMDTRTNSSFFACAALAVVCCSTHGNVYISSLSLHFYIATYVLTLCRARRRHGGG